MGEKTLADECSEVIAAAREMFTTWGGTPNFEACLRLATRLHTNRLSLAAYGQAAASLVPPCERTILAFDEAPDA